MVFLLFCFGYFFTNNNIYNVVNHRIRENAIDSICYSVVGCVNISFEQCSEKPILRLLYIRFGIYSIFEIDLIL